MEIKDFTCGLDCPVQSEVQYCCAFCRLRKDFVTDENRHLYSEKLGFWSPEGCRLPRDGMPKSCREYNCRDYKFALVRRFDSNKWKTTIVGCFTTEYLVVTEEVNTKPE